MESQTHRRLTVIVSSDVVGYSRLMGRDEAGTLAVLNDCRTGIIDPKLSRLGGHIVKTMGDGLLIEFASAVDALQWAVDVQREMAGLNAARDPDWPVQLRIGIHIGDIIAEEGDIFGDGVNIAARLQEIADPGGVCISAAVHEQILGKTGQPFDDLGYKRLKNIDRPVHVLKARLAGVPSGGENVHAWPHVAGAPQAQKPLAAGGCLCGRVRYEVRDEAAAVGYCHCRMCQLALGAPLNAWAAFRKSDVRFSGDPPRLYRSSPIAVRAFCAECGTSLYTEIEGAGSSEYYSIRLATLDNPEAFPPACHFGVESQLPWLNIEDDLPRIRTEDDEILSSRWTAAGEPKGGPPRKTALERFRSGPGRKD